MGDYIGTMHVWQVMDRVHFVVVVADLDVADNASRAVLRVEDTLIADREDDPRIWLGEALLGALEIL